MSFLYTVLGAAVALAGGDKLAGNRAYAGMFRQLGWSRGDMQIAAAAELSGGLLMAGRSTRRLGAAVVAASSAAILYSELRHDDSKLATARGFILVAALAALVAPGRT
jgi:hypothetical protein